MTPFGAMRLRKSGGGWTPAAGPSLKGWWVADNPSNTLASGFLSVLVDKSVTGNNASTLSGAAGNQATLVASALNGRTIWRSDSVSKKGFFVPSDTSIAAGVSGLTLAMVSLVSPSVGTTNAEVFRYNTNAATARAMIGRNNGTSAFAGAVYAGGRRLDADSFAGAQDAVNHGTSWLIQVAVFDYANATLTLSVDGTLTTNGAFQTTGSTSPTGSNAIGIGHSGAGTAPAYGDYAEGAVFQAALGTTNRQKLEGYLAWQWGLQGNLPSSHPYAWVAP